MKQDPETTRLEEDHRREKNWKRWGPYLSERQWGTVREDYSAGGDTWSYFPHDHARLRAYRWGEDGLLGITDRQCRLCFALALWNEEDPILKERLFGLTGPEGNHGEDVKELYYYLDSTPTHSYMKALYKYPQTRFPYERLVAENGRRTRNEPELELVDTGIFDGGRYFDVTAEYAKAGPNDLLIRITATNRGPEAKPLHLLPTLWFRNTWIVGPQTRGDSYWPEPLIERETRGCCCTSRHDSSLGQFDCAASRRRRGARCCSPRTRPTPSSSSARERDTARRRRTPSTRYVVSGATRAAVSHAGAEGHEGRVPLHHAARSRRAGVADHRASASFSEAERHGRASSTTSTRSSSGAPRRGRSRSTRSASPDELDAPERTTDRRGRPTRSLLWTNQVYHYVVERLARGRSGPSRRRRKSAGHGRNSDWRHLFNLDVVSMPDKWEYPWYAAWDLAFHMIPYANGSTRFFAKQQLLLFLREWYMHPERADPRLRVRVLGDVNPPVHAWAVWRTYKPRRGARSIAIVTWLARCFQKLLLNYGPGG